jgi:hypothetical protein
MTKDHRPVVGAACPLESARKAIPQRVPRAGRTDDSGVMNAFTQVGEPSLSVAAGAEVTTELLLHNEGSVVDQFVVDIVGPARDWVSAEPAIVNLMPGGEAVVTVRFAPPRSAEVVADAYPYGVRIRSREYPENSTVVEGHVEVEPFAAMDAELLPTKRRGSRKAKYRLAVENAGNTPVKVELDAVDPEDDQLRIRLDRNHFTVRPATVALLRVRVAPFDRFLRGDPRPHPFELRVVPESGEPLVVKGLMTQERMLPKWVIPALAMLSVVAVALTVLWFAVLAPSVKSIATQQVSGQVDDAKKAANAANAAAAKADGSDRDAKAKLSQAAAASAANQPKPLDFRVATFADPATDGSYQTFSFTAPGRKAMDISDIMLQNPRADKGFLRIEIGGKVLLEAGLANFTDQTYSYSKGLHVAAGQQVVVAVNCVTPGTGSVRCSPAVSFSAQVLP